MGNEWNDMNNINICKLTPERLDDYLYFFENIAHTDNKEWGRCYCVNFCSDNNLGIAELLRDPEVRRKYAIKYVNENIIQGYLAYYDGQVIGWCNTNDKKDCLGCFGWQIISGKTKAIEESIRVKSVFCFTVAPSMRGKHVATALLERVIQDATKEGYDYIESYPNKTECDMYYNFVGPIGLYEKFGFIQFGETENRLVFRKKLYVKDANCLQ
ncbi:GNAT family N-acetyltransferase [Clostridium beijerinckii]|nr:GNAT family N-acetyltransferase [Clostridium beijerinckii]